MDQISRPLEKRKRKQIFLSHCRKEKKEIKYRKLVQIGENSFAQQVRNKAVSNKAIVR